MRIVNHKIVQEPGDAQTILQESTSNKGGSINPEYIIIHFTAGRSAESSVAWFKDSSARASAHLVIGRDGRIFQLMDFTRQAWHAGSSRWAGLKNFNNLSIGIELDNPGRLTKVGDRYVSWFKKDYTSENVVEAVHKHESSPTHWYEYTEPQIEACFEVCKAIRKKYDIKDVLGHEDVSPYRKTDPGPLFPMESFRARLFGREDEVMDIYEVTGNNVNIRRGPGTEFNSLGQLHQGTQVEFMRAEKGWFFVFVLEKPANNEEMLYGWIYEGLLRKV